MLTRWRSGGGVGQPWIAVESLYSMDGDRAPLDDLIGVAARHEAMLVIDEAHATGVFGAAGRGLGAHLEGRANVISVHTCGKALGVMGAIVIAPKTIKDFLINRARSFIYATAPSPHLGSVVTLPERVAGGAAERGTRRRRGSHGRTDAEISRSEGEPT